MGRQMLRFAQHDRALPSRLCPFTERVQGVLLILCLQKFELSTLNVDKWRRMCRSHLVVKSNSGKEYMIVMPGAYGGQEVVGTQDFPKADGRSGFVAWGVRGITIEYIADHSQ